MLLCDKNIPSSILAPAGYGHLQGLPVCKSGSLLPIDSQVICFSHVDTFEGRSTLVRKEWRQQVNVVRF